jgi:molybdopterin-biosynthesis enzyme MoeA-like protein
MGEFPQNANIIPNPFNKIPGFSVPNPGGDGAHYFLPGFPVMAWPMIEWVLDTNYTALFHQRAWLEKSVLVYSAAESMLTPMMEGIEAEFPQVKVFSLPHVGDEKTRRHIELGVKGAPVEVERAYQRMLDGLHGFGLELGVFDAAGRPAQP